MPLFTSANAREMAARGNYARWHAKPSPPPEPPKPATPPQLAEDDYAAERLMRVREQLAKVDRMILEETDPQRLDRLASAQLRLSEQERILDDRPLPGSRRPAQERPASQVSSRPMPRLAQPPTPPPGPPAPQS